MRVLLCLLAHMNFKKPRGSSYPPVSTIADEIGASPRSVKRALAELRERKIIRLERRRTTKHRMHRGTGCYSILLTPRPLSQSSKMRELAQLAKELESRR